jgi:hypothetical protein
VRDRFGERLLVLGIGEELELARMGEELGLDEDGRHCRLAEDGEIGLFDTAVPVTREAAHQAREHGDRRAAPRPRPREVVNLDPVDGRGCRAVGMDADEQVRL